MEASLVAALLAARDDAATQAFEDALRSAEAGGRIDPTTVRELRYWHARSLEALVDHAALVIPAALAARRASDAAGREAAAEARLSWQQARALAASAAEAAADVDVEPEPGAPSRRAGGVGLTVVSDDD